MLKFYLIILLVVILAVISECKVVPQHDENPQHHLEHFEGKDGDVNCFGLGSLIAKILQWILNDKPAHVGDERVLFLIHSPTSKVPYQLYVEDEKLFEITYSDFDPERKSVFIIHGFGAHGDNDWIQKMVDAYLALDNVNVIVVDWSRYSTTLNYYKAVVNAKNAAREISKFMHLVVGAYPKIKDWGKIHFIGHSLGAHVSGMAADEFNKLNCKWNITRITGLDPARPCFAASSLSLSKNDAPFVDIIHTNGNLLAGMGLGLKNPIGHVDFYANGGQRQPGCWREASKWERPRAEIMEAICSHQRSYNYFTESLLLAAENIKTKFWGHRWNLSPQKAEPLVGKICDSDNCIEMGINAVKYTQRGVFFVSTGNNSPYCVITESDRLDILHQLKLDGSDDMSATNKTDDN